MIKTGCGRPSAAKPELGWSSVDDLLICAGFVAIIVTPAVVASILRRRTFKG
jgi:hypothetical protein